MGSTTMLWPRQAGKYIASKAVDVTINQHGIHKCSLLIANAFKDGKLKFDDFKLNELFPLHKGLSQDELADWIFLIDSLNFNFWTAKNAPKFAVTHNGKTHTGYMAMVLAVNRAIDTGLPIFSPYYYSKLSLENLKVIFKSDTESPIPLLEKRVQVISEVGNVLVNKFKGQFINVLKLANGSALKLVDIVTNEFPSFRDIHTYEGESVAIFKRVQILVADIAVLYQGKGPGAFGDIDKLTMFADYRVPQTLKYFGVLTYSASLMKKLNEDYLFAAGDREEVEIRGISIHAVELLVEETKKILLNWNLSTEDVNSIKIDFFLWDFRYSNADKLECVPFHKIRCMYY